MPALICGSFAYDNIMLFPGKFKDHILADKLDMLNVCFMVPEMRREFGGCAGNIAYNLKLLGSEPVPAATVGKDFDIYADWLSSNNINSNYLKHIEDSYTAQAFITTDSDGNQLTMFHPGAMTYAHQNDIDIAAIKKDIDIAIIAPDGRDSMIRYAEQFAATGIPFIFDPGQGLPMFDSSQLKIFLRQSRWVAFNDYEWQMVQHKTNLDIADLLDMVEALIITQGDQGSRIYTADKCYEIAAVSVSNAVDPTGCGDAYRAGLLYGLMNKLDWQTTGQIASLIGAIKVQSHGTQNHSFTMAEFQEKYKEINGEPILSTGQRC